MGETEQQNDALLKMRSVLEEVSEERVRQLRKWGIQDHSLTTWIAILTEEVGEAAKPAVDFDLVTPPKDGEKSLELLEAQVARLRSYRAELVQVAAVAVQMIEAVDADYLMN